MLPASHPRAGPIPTGKALEVILATGPKLPAPKPDVIDVIWRQIGSREDYHPDLVALVGRHAQGLLNGSHADVCLFEGEFWELTWYILNTIKLPDGRSLYCIATYNPGGDRSPGQLLKIPTYAFWELAQFNKKQAILVAWTAKRGELVREWERVWALECAPAVAAAKEAAERKRVADDEAAILAEAKRRLAEETRERRIQTIIRDLRLDAGIDHGDGRVSLNGIIYYRKGPWARAIIE
jgi:hypothetical protein